MSRRQIGHGRAFLSGAIIFVYFAFFTAWLPSMLIRSSFLSTAPKGVADGITLAVWGGFLLLGVAALRWAQDRELI